MFNVLLTLTTLNNKIQIQIVPFNHQQGVATMATEDRARMFLRKLYSLDNDGETRSMEELTRRMFAYLKGNKKTVATFKKKVMQELVETSNTFFIEQMLEKVVESFTDADLDFMQQFFESPLIKKLVSLQDEMDENDHSLIPYMDEAIDRYVEEARSLKLLPQDFQLTS